MKFKVPKPIGIWRDAQHPHTYTHTHAHAQHQSGSRLSEKLNRHVWNNQKLKCAETGLYSQFVLSSPLKPSRPPTKESIFSLIHKLLILFLATVKRANVPSDVYIILINTVLNCLLNVSLLSTWHTLTHLSITQLSPFAIYRWGNPET